MNQNPGGGPAIPRSMPLYLRGRMWTIGLTKEDFGSVSISLMQRAWITAWHHEFPRARLLLCPWGRLHPDSFGRPSEPDTFKVRLREWLGRGEEWSDDRPPPRWIGWAWTGEDPASSDPLAHRCCIGAAWAAMKVSMRDGLPFATAIVEAGRDATPALIAADWMEERGETRKADWTRGLAEFGADREPEFNDLDWWG